MGVYTSDEQATPSVPSSGNRSLYPKSDGWYEINSAGVESKVFDDTPNVHGKNYEFISNQGEDTNSTNVFKTYAGISYPAGIAIAGQKYEVEFHSLIRYSTTGRNFIMRAAIDGVTIENEIQWELKDTGGDIRLAANYKFIIDGTDLNNAGGFVDYDFRAQQNGDTARVYACTLIFKRVK